MGTGQGRGVAMTADRGIAGTAGRAGVRRSGPVSAALDLSLTEPSLDEAVRAGLAAFEGRLRSAVQQADPIADDTARHLV